MSAEQDHPQVLRWPVLVILALVTMSLARTTMIAFLSWQEVVRTAPADVAALGYLGLVVPLGYGGLSLLGVMATGLFFAWSRPRRQQRKSSRTQK